jgi:hypothetical protein
MFIFICPGCNDIVSSKHYLMYRRHFTSYRYHFVITHVVVVVAVAPVWKAPSSSLPISFFFLASFFLAVLVISFFSSVPIQFSHFYFFCPTLPFHPLLASCLFASLFGFISLCVDKIYIPSIYPCDMAPNNHQRCIAANFC